MIRPVAFGLVLALGLAGCAQWNTEYTQVEAAQASQWRVRDVTVSVPETLTTSDENSPIPSADIVWQGEPAGDRRAQVAAILREGITAGSTGLGGKQPVTIAATVTKFHAITPEGERLIRTFSNAGVDNIAYTVQVFDARSGAALTQPQAISAPMPASSASNRAEIVAHIAAVTQNWLGGGTDQRTSFSRFGR